MFGKRHIKRVPVRDHSDDWFNLRYAGIKLHPGGVGGSDIAVVLGLSQYKGAHQLYFEKVGAHIPPRINNPRLQRGKDVEPLMYEYYKFFRGDDSWAEDWEDFVQNIKPKHQPWEYKKFYYRDNRLVKYPIYNTKLPFLVMNMDFILPRGYKMFGSEETVPCDCPVEAKSINYLIERKYETGVPPAYYTQIQGQMMVMEAPYGEILFWIDGELKLYPVFANQAIQDIIHDKCKEFWERVERGRMIMEQLRMQKPGTADFEELASELQYHAPDVHPISAEEDFIKESWKKEQESIDCDPKLNEDFYLYNILKQVENIVKKELQQGHKNNMLLYLTENKVAKAIISEKESFVLQERKYGEKVVPTLSPKGAYKLTVDEKKKLTKDLKELVSRYKREFHGQDNGQGAD